MISSWKSVTSHSLSFPFVLPSYFEDNIFFRIFLKFFCLWLSAFWLMCSIVVFFFFLIYFFPTVQQGDQVILTCIHFARTFCSVAVLVSRQSSQCYSAGSPCKSILSCVWEAQAPDPSHSHQAATSLFSKSMIFFSVEMFICAGY